MTGKTVLVTGGSGFIGAHVIVHELEKGHRVRTTMRSLSSSYSVREKISNGGILEEQVNAVDFFEVDLLGDKGWDDACKCCDFVIHVASPYPLNVPKNENELIKPAREGTLRALRAAKKSRNPISYGHEKRTKDNPFTEKDRTVLKDAKSPVGAYEKSKTLAEQAAWEWLKNDGESLELAMLGNEENIGLELPTRMLNGNLPWLPNLSFSTVDFFVSAKDISRYLRQGLPATETKKVLIPVLPKLL
ncbi:NAD(P)-binding protein [Mytilinidion resinicola]|uniref:NAD(P)-binding protein n=1 Tax=Mytilinidion resinicola TaxID=574789 RepID=A0A6A6YRA4_9PEZI|nr:NAD(P)-binding protein [Mytilinidion resinicola]KAF2811301.1 NAD(P)-binding protein [Mytilinidion resinicola]